LASDLDSWGSVGLNGATDDAYFAGFLVVASLVKVAFAASSGLLWRGNSSGYVIYSEGLVGQRKSGEGPVEDEKSW